SPRGEIPQIVGTQLVESRHPNEDSRSSYAIMLTAVEGHPTRVYRGPASAAKPTLTDVYLPWAGRGGGLFSVASDPLKRVVDDPHPLVGAAAVGVEPQG